MSEMKINGECISTRRLLLLLIKLFLSFWLPAQCCSPKARDLNREVRGKRWAHTAHCHRQPGSDFHCPPLGKSGEAAMWHTLWCFSKVLRVESRDFAHASSPLPNFLSVHSDKLVRSPLAFPTSKVRSTLLYPSTVHLIFWAQGSFRIYGSFSGYDSPLGLVHLGWLLFRGSRYLVDKWITAWVSRLFFRFTRGKQVDTTIFISNFYQRTVKCKELQHVTNHDCCHFLWA